MALTQLLGGPNWDVVTFADQALFADFHYFFNSGSVIRTNPWNSPQAPIAKVLNVKNITANSVVANYVSSSGQLTNVILTSGSTAQITSQTLPLGLDNNNWLSASIVSDFTGSITARPTGSRWFELQAIRTSFDTYVYTIPDGSTDIIRTTTGQPSSGSLRYRCSRTIPYLDQPVWIIRDLFDCTGGTTTTTTTTTAPFYSTAEFNWTSLFGSNSINYSYLGTPFVGTVSSSLTRSAICMDVSGSLPYFHYGGGAAGTDSQVIAGQPFFCSGSVNQAFNMTVRNSSTTDYGNNKSYFYYVNEAGNIINDVLDFGESRNIISQTAGFFQKSYTFANYNFGLEWTINSLYTGSVTAYPYKNYPANYTIQYKRLPVNREPGGTAQAVVAYLEPYNPSKAKYTFSAPLAVSGTFVVSSSTLPMGNSFFLISTESALKESILLMAIIKER